MRPRRGGLAILAHPRILGGAALLILAWALYLSYSALTGLPFVPTYAVDVQLPDAAQLAVVQENGSVTPFTLLDGAYLAPARVLASLVQQPDGRFVFERNDGMRYVFSTAGDLVEVVDRNDNTVTLTRTDGVLTRVLGTLVRPCVSPHTLKVALVTVANSGDNVSIYLPIFATSARRFSSTLSPLGSFSASRASSDAGFLASARAATACAKARKSCSRATKSVSQLISTSAAVCASGDFSTTTTPSAATREAFLSAFASPCLRMRSAAASRSPFVSTSAFLHSIIPAPVRSRSCLTASAVMFIGKKSCNSGRSGTGARKGPQHSSAINVTRGPRHLCGARHRRSGGVEERAAWASARQPPARQPPLPRRRDPRHRRWDHLPAPAPPVQRDDGVRQRVIERFGQAGVEADRLILQPRMSFSDYLALHHTIDLALDPFPYNGGTTTMHSLWMGVPVITLAGEHMVSRCAVPLLSRVGLSDFITHNEEDYFQLAMRMAQDLPGLDRIRQSLRERMSASNYGPETVTRHLEAAYREMWRTWCSS